MITSAKNCTKNKKRKMDRQNARTNDKSKAIQTKSHKEAYTHEKRKRKKIYIYIKKGREQPNQ